MMKRSITFILLCFLSILLINAQTNEDALNAISSEVELAYKGRINFSQTVSSIDRAIESKACIVLDKIYINNFVLGEPANSTKYPNYVDDEFILSAEFYNGLYYLGATNLNYTQGYGRLYSMDPNTGYLKVINSQMSSRIYSYNPIDNEMYGLSLGQNPSLYTIDPSTGEEVFVRTINTDHIIISFEVLNDGRFIGIDITSDEVIEIDPLTGNITSLFNVGFETHYGQDMAVDRETGELYWASFNTANYEAKLYRLNIEEGTKYFIGTFPLQASGFAINSFYNGNVPAKPENVVMTSGNDYSDVTLTWKNPNLNVSGNSLTDISKIIISRNGEVVHTIDNPTIGADETWTDTNVPTAKQILYSIQAINNEGYGEIASDYVILAETCTIKFELEDTSTYDDGWSGASISVLSEGEAIANIALPYGDLGEVVTTVPIGQLDFSWHMGVDVGTFDSECYFKIFDNNLILIYESLEIPDDDGVFFSWENTCEEVETYVVTGKVTAEHNGAALENVEVAFNYITTYTDVNGNYSITVPEGNYDVNFTLDGYFPYTEQNFNVSQATTLNATLALNEQCNPVRNLTALNDGSNVITVQWDYPEGFTPTTGATHELTWASLESVNSIGKQEPSDFNVANRFDVNDLADYVGWKLKKIKFNPNEVQCDYSIRAWIGDNATELVLDQSVSNPVIGGLTSVDVNTDVTIEAGKELWIGYRCVLESGFPAGVSAGPAVIGKGDMLGMNDTWVTLTSLNMDYNFIVIGVIENERGETANLVLNNVSNGTFEGTIKSNPNPVIKNLNNYRNRSLEGYVLSITGDLNEIVIDNPNTNSYVLDFNKLNKNEVVEICLIAQYTTCESEKVCTEVELIEAIDDVATLNVYPNPATNDVKISGVNVEVVYIYNSIGQLVEKVYGNTIDVSQYNQGMYIFNIITLDGKNAKAKVLINR